MGMDIFVCLLTYLWVALGGDSIDPKPETCTLFWECMRWGSRAGNLGTLGVGGG